jgi:hypothetical protein
MFDTLYTATVTKAKLPGMVLSMLRNHFNADLRLEAKHSNNGWLYLAVLDSDRTAGYSGLYVVHYTGFGSKSKSLEFKVYQESECPHLGAMCSQNLLDLTEAFRAETNFALLSQAYNCSTNVLQNAKTHPPVFLFHGDGYQHPAMDFKIVGWISKSVRRFNRILAVAVDSIGDEMNLDFDKTSIFQHGFTHLDPDSYGPVFEPDGAGELVTLGSMVFETTPLGLQVAGAAPTSAQYGAYRRERMAATHALAAPAPMTRPIFL